MSEESFYDLGNSNESIDNITVSFVLSDFPCLNT